MRWERVVGAYRACLYQAGFGLGGTKIRFTGKKEVNDLAGGIAPTKGLSGEEVVTWFTAVCIRSQRIPNRANPAWSSCTTTVAFPNIWTFCRICPSRSSLGLP